MWITRRRVGDEIEVKEESQEAPLVITVTGVREVKGNFIVSLGFEGNDNFEFKFNEKDKKTSPCN